MSASIDFIYGVRDIVWGVPLLIALLSVGLLQTIRLKGIQFRYLGHALKLVLQHGKELQEERKNKANIKQVPGEISSFQALMTALAGAIGAGNITGIAAAVSIGGFGALFWMVIIAILGMATAYSEAVLAIKYRATNVSGHVAGGPMYTLLHGLKANKLAALFAIFAVLGSFTTGCMMQSNAVADAVVTMLPYKFVTVGSGYISIHAIIGLSIAAIVGGVLVGGIRSIGNIAGTLVPVMAISYLLAGLFVIACNIDQLGNAMLLIVQSAFTGQSATGAFVGSSVMLAVRMGVTKGLFSNEAGLGSLSIAAAAAQTDIPAKQGMYAISGVFIATIVVCSITGLSLAVTNVLGQELANGEAITGSAMALAAFGSVLPGFRYVVVIGLILFALTTMLAWAYYGEKCIEYLLGSEIIVSYRWVFILMIVVGAALELHVVLALADIANAFMVIPNIISIVGLSSVVEQETDNYLANLE